MKQIVVANSKGGAGKTITAVTLAAALATRGQHVCIADADPQNSAHQWYKRRPVTAPRVDCVNWSLDEKTFPKVPKKTDWIVVDCPSRLDAEMAKPILKNADFLVVPVMDSMFDELATRKFLRSLQDIKRIRKDKIQILPIGSRVDLRRTDTRVLVEFMKANKFPLQTLISERSAYSSLARSGLSVFDQTQAPFRAMQQQWEPVLQALTE